MAQGLDRLAIQDLLEELLGSTNVYFQPPANVQLQYPCIIYNRDYAYSENADNAKYYQMKRYQVIAVDHNPDSDIRDKIADLPMASFNRFYVAENLNHDVFNVFF